MAAAFIAAGVGIAALAAGGGYIQMESGKKENQVRISLDFSGDREIGKYMEDIGAVQADLALETPEPEDIIRAEFTFEASIQKDPDVKIRDGIFLEDTGRFSIFLAGNGTGDGLFNGGKKLELGVLQTASMEDITLRVERIAAAAGEELVFEKDGGRENEFLLKATDPGEDQGETGAGDGDGSGDDGTSGDGDGTDGNTGNGQGNNGGSGRSGKRLRRKLRRQLPPGEEHRLYLSPGICQGRPQVSGSRQERTGSSGFLAARWLWTAGSLRASNGTIWEQTALWTGAGITRRKQEAGIISGRTVP